MVISCIKSAELALEVLEEEYNRNPTKELYDEIEKLEDTINRYKHNLSLMSEIENRLYYKIKYLGKNPTLAIKEVADENYFNDVKPSSVSVLWNIYSEKVKKFI